VNSQKAFCISSTPLPCVQSLSRCVGCITAVLVYITAIFLLLVSTSPGQSKERAFETVVSLIEGKGG
jgi:hypothetical protein